MIVTLILFIIILGVTVLVHEGGHFLFAKLVGVHVYEFSIGMGPAIVKKVAKDKTVYAIRAIPIGGFVSLAGEENDVDLEKQKGHNLQDKTVFQRFLVMFMGVGFNFIFAFLVLLVSAFIYGSSNLKPVITDTPEGYPAYNAGLNGGDVVLKINNHKVRYLDDISLYMAIEDLSKELNFEVLKEDGSTKTYSVKPEKQISSEGEETYVIGITLANEVEKGFGESFVNSFKKMGAIFKQMFVVLGNLFTGKISVNKLSGPIGIYTVVGEMKTLGLNAMLYLVALLCINVGVINLLPFPAFDGGRILFLIIEKVKGSPVNPKVENVIHSVGFILLILLMIYVTFNDIIRLF